VKEPLTEVTKVPEAEPTTPPTANPNPNDVVAEKEEKRSNGAHTPV